MPVRSGEIQTLLGRQQNRSANFVSPSRQEALRVLPALRGSGSSTCARRKRKKKTVSQLSLRGTELKGEEEMSQV